MTATPRPAGGRRIPGGRAGSGAFPGGRGWWARMAAKQVVRRGTPARGPVSTWWLLAKDGDPRAGVFFAEHAGERALPVFSGEGEAEMFLWLGGLFEDGWRIKETTAGELISILYGPCAGVGWVTLDPSPEMLAQAVRAESVSRERFVQWVSNSPRSAYPQAHTRRHARGPVGPA